MTGFEDRPPERPPSQSPSRPPSQPPNSPPAPADPAPAEQETKRVEFDVSRQRPVVVENPPPPQAVIEGNTYVPYQVDDYADANAWAERQYVAKYPGKVEDVRIIASLRNQRLKSLSPQPT